MKFEQNELLDFNRFNKVFLLIVLLILPKLSWSQATRIDSISPPVYKNAVKAMPILLPFVGVAFYSGISFGYERIIKKHHSLEVCSNYYFNVDEMGGQFHNFSIMPGYKYFFVSENKRLNDSWAGVFLSYNQEYQTVSDGDGGQNRQYSYGIGVSIGKKIYLSKNKSLFLDLGFGLSFNKWLDEPILSDTKWEDKYMNNRILPRPILQFGWKF